jgi:anti-anti-sigma factor
MPHIRTREREGIVLIDVSGSMSESAELLHAEIAKCLARGLSGVVLNLEQETYIDSTWLGAIVTTFAKLRTAGGQLKLLNVPPNLMKTLAVTRLSTVFDIFTSEDDAVNSYFPARPLLYPRAMRETDVVWPAANERSPLVVFLCHSSGDKDAVRVLHGRLRAARARPWLDEVDLVPGQVWEREIPAAVRRSDAVLVCLSAESVAKTGFLQKEIKFALDAAEEQSDDSIFIIPGRLETCDVPERLRRWQWVDLFAADGYDRLITALQARALALGRSPLQIA